VHAKIKDRRDATPGSRTYEQLAADNRGVRYWQAQRVPPQPVERDLRRDSVLIPVARAAELVAAREALIVG